MNHPPFRIGHGFDLHRLVEGRKLILGGIEIPHERGLLGHSDADCLIHALADAILGALAKPDIGHLFPDSDPANKDMDSTLILAQAVEIAKEQGFLLANVDITLIAQRPKIGPHIASIRSKLAPLLNLTENQIGIKATTHEKIGSLGREEGIAAHAVCLLYRQ
jgi:2-C-methyl-D-erythritol 2,4-cyclodiphosphate synthase